MFQDNGFQIAIEIDLVQADFLDVTLDLQTGKYWPYRKPNDTLLYIHAKSNHPSNIKKQLPSMIGRRISEISCNEEEFMKVKPAYDEALKRSGFSDGIEFQQDNEKTRRRKRNIVWFNPPYSDHVKTNVGKEFFNVLDKHFPPHHKLRKICNRNNIKISYSCMPSMESIITKHNKSILRPKLKKNGKMCNCSKNKKERCPLNGHCLESSIVYKVQ